MTESKVTAEQLLSILHNHEHELAKVKARAEWLQDRLTTDLEELRTFLEAGGTTGDAVMDLAYLSGQATNTKEVVYCRRLAQELRGMVGQAVLICYGTEVPRSIFRSDRPENYRHALWFRAGVLGAETLVLQKYKDFFVETILLTLEVPRFICGEANMDAIRHLAHLPSSVIERNILLSTSEQAPPTLVQLLAQGEQDWANPSIIVGTANVQSWLTRHKVMLDFDKALQLLSKPAVEPAETS